MKSIAFFVSCGLLLGSAACENRTADREPAPPATAPAREEGPAERVGRVVDESAERAAEAVGQGLEEAGREIQQHTSDPEPPEPQPD